MVYKYNYKGQRENYAPRAVAEENKEVGGKKDAGKQIGMSVGIAVGVALVLGLGFYFYSKKKDESANMSFGERRFGFDLF
jgi:LPXTG-motif cell wall-anchored protein